MPISKGEFARRRNVSAARVSQWLSEGKISGAAIVGEGRGALIDEALACQQLDQKLDIDQRHSGNGLKTTLAPAVNVEAPSGNTVADRIAEQRLELLQRQNREKATEEAALLGRLCDTAQARQAPGKEIARASAIAAKFKLPHRDVLHELRGEWRKIRQNAAIEARERAEPLPATTGFDLEDA